MRTRYVRIVAAAALVGVTSAGCKSNDAAPGAGSTSGSSAAAAVVSAVGGAGAAATRDELIAHLNNELGDSQLMLDSETVVSYEREPPTDLIEAAQAPGTAKLRSILIDHGSVNNFDKDNPITEGYQIHLIYDEHDALLAIDVSHYLYD